MAKTLHIGGAIPQLGVAARSNRYVLAASAAAAVLLVGSTLQAHAHMGAPGPQIKAFLPICATIWCFAELLTAFFLMSQFYVGGKLSFALIAAGYGIGGLMTIPYLICFPGVFTNAPYTLGFVQISGLLWLVWHLTFPISIAAAHVLDGTLDSKVVSRNAIASTVATTVVSSFAFTILTSVALYFGRDWLPHIITLDGHFTSLYKDKFVPVVVVVNALSIGIVFFRARHISPLQLWIAIALLTMTLDGIVNCWAPGRYSLVWYVGKFEALLTSLVVLMMLLIEVATLYRRLYQVASIDTLTGLPNRRSFNDNLSRTLEDREERASGVALLVIDVDNFKTYNDRYGHAAGDTALAAVAGALNGSLVRASDTVARFGGEEFVILLPDVLVDEVEHIAERVRARVAKLGLIHEGSSTSFLTVSVGAAFCSRHQAVTAGALFDFADRALYTAKANGRNCVVVRHLSDGARERRAPALAV